MHSMVNIINANGRERTFFCSKSNLRGNFRTIPEKRKKSLAWLGLMQEKWTEKGENRRAKKERKFVCNG
jgi:hypothetical protein